MKPLFALTLVTLIGAGGILAASPAQPTAAQTGTDNCDQIKEAINLTQQACQDTTGRNQACYGNITLSAEPQPGITDLRFEQQGDLADLDAIRSLQLSSQVDDNTWGIAWLQLQAGLPEDEPERNLTLLLFGDVRIQNEVEPAPEPVTLSITASGNLNVRGGPSTSDAVIGSLGAGQTVTADGRLEDSTWLHVRLDAEQTGWVFAELVSTEDDLSRLAVLDPAAETQTPRFGPMQAFTLETGADDPLCEEAPDSGLLVQTPEGVAEVTLRVNEVDIRLHSTAYLQAQASGEMTINLVEGSAQVEAAGEAVSVPAGTRVRVPLDANLQASGPPSDPEPYDDAALAALPLDILMREVTLVPALPQEEIEALQQAVPMAGEWLFTPFCAYSGTVTVILTPTEDGLTLTVEGREFFYVKTEPGLYVRTTGGVTYTMRVQSPTRVEETWGPISLTGCEDFGSYELVTAAE